MRSPTSTPRTPASVAAIALISVTSSPGDRGRRHLAADEAPADDGDAPCRGDVAAQLGEVVELAQQPDPRAGQRPGEDGLAAAAQHEAVVLERGPVREVEAALGRGQPLGPRAESKPDVGALVLLRRALEHRGHRLVDEHGLREPGAS